MLELQETNCVADLNRQSAGGNKTGVLLALQLALLLAALDQTVISTAMPRIATQLDGFDRYAWVTTAYLLTSTAALPIFGKLADLYGRKPVFMSGLWLFVLTSVLCGLAGTVSFAPYADGMTQLITARCFQGIAGGIILGLSFTIVADMFAPAERGKYQGLFAAVFALASIVGPTLGGWIADSFSWRWDFYINVPIGLLALSAFHFSYGQNIQRSAKSIIDWWGVTTLVAFLFPFLIGLSLVGEQGWQSPTVILLLAFSALMAFAFLFIERRVMQPILPLFLFDNRVVAISSWSIFVTGIGMFGSILLIPLFMQSVLSMSASQSGSYLTPLIITVAIFSVISGLMIASRGAYKKLILAGLLLMTAGVFGLSAISGSTPLPVILGQMLIVGAGLGILLPIYTIVIQSVVPEETMGISTGLSQFFRSIGGTVGTAIFGSLMLNGYRRHLLSGFHGQPSPLLLSALKNPAHPGLITQRFASSPAFNEHALQAILPQVREAMVYAIDSVFFIYALLLGATLVLNCYLEEVPLRKSTGTSAGL